MKPAWKPQVYLVGAGPGDPGLLTRRGEALLKQADVVFHDALIHPGVLSLIPKRTVRVAVGKRAGRIGPAQEAIQARMIEAARAGQTVVRLKGGDPFVFGRGGEEIRALADAGIRFEVVPGVSSASAVPAMIGIPVTMRGVSSVLHIVTGHEDPADRESPVPWDLLTRPGHTVVVLMGSARLIGILQRLKSSGMDESTPLAVIHWGTLGRQRSLRGTLGEALAHPERFSLGSPALAVIGAVAGMDESLNWFERRPLFGRRILLTRPEGSADAMVEALGEAGADVINCPVVRFDGEERDDDTHLIEWMEALRSRVGWLILPSSAAIRFLFEALGRLELDARALSGFRVAVLSRKAAKELERHGIRADFVPDCSEGSRLAETLPLEGEHPLAVVAGSAASRAELREGLEKRGAQAELHVLYATRADRGGARAALERIVDRWAQDVVVFSPSAVKALIEFQRPEDVQAMDGLRWWAIGPTTATALREAGLEPAGEAEEPTAEALIEALAASGR